jgi:hypothetical protein
MWKNIIECISDHDPMVKIGYSFLNKISLIYWYSKSENM